MGCVALLCIACGEKNVTPPEPEVKPVSDLVVSESSLMAPVGEGVSAIVSSGNESYNAFSLDPEIATASVSGNVIAVETHSLGKTQIVVSDAKYKVARIDVVAYQEPGVTLEDSQKTGEIIVGESGTFTVAVLSGNGGYEITSDTDGVSARYDEASGNIIVSAVGKIDDYSAVLTVTDVCGFQETIQVTVTPSFNYWTDARKQTVINSTSSFYYSVPSFLNTATSFNLTRKQTSSSYTYHAAKTETGYSYGYQRMYTNNPPNNIRYVDVQIDIKGDLSVGKKEGHLYGIYYYLSNGDLWWNSILDTDTDERNIIEIVSNNGTLVKGVVSYFYDGAVHNMYFIDSVVN